MLPYHEGRNLCHLLGIHLQGVFISSLSFVHSITSLCGFLDVCFIYWIIIHYFFILSLALFQLCPLGALSVDSDSPSMYPFHCVCVYVCVSVFLCSGHYRFLQYRVFIHFSSSRINCFSKKLWYFSLESCIRKHYLGSGCAHYYWGGIASSPSLGWQSKATVCTNLCIYTYLSTFL